MKIEFEIQRFAEDAADVEEQTAAQSEESAEQSEVSQDGAEQQEQIPEELAFLDEPYRSEALKELKEYQQSQTQPQEQEQKPQSTENQLPPAQAQPQPQQVDEMTALRNEVAQLKAQVQRYQQFQPPQVQQPQPQPQRQPQPEFSKQDMDLIKQSIHNRALQISGFTQTDLDSFEWADDDDERRERWKFAEEAATRDVWNTVYRVKDDYERQRARVQQELETSRQSFNAFVTNEQKEPDFQQVVNHSMNDFFKKLDPQAKNVVSAAYWKIEHDSKTPRREEWLATPQDAWIVRNYYQNAKADFRSSQQKAAPKAKAKTTPPPNLPKIDQAQGTTGTTDAEISMAELERLINAGDDSKIPKKYLDYMNKANVFK